MLDIKPKPVTIIPVMRKLINKEFPKLEAESLLNREKFIFKND